MGLSRKRENELKILCLEFRKRLVKLLYHVQTGHPGGSLSCVEIITTLYQEKMNIDFKNESNKTRDRFILSKGHAAPVLYLNLASKGALMNEELTSLRQLNSRLQGHPCYHKTPGVDLSTGPLGLGLSAGIGMAIAARLKDKNSNVYVLLGDGEIQEGCIWEAAMSAAKFKLDNLIAILDYNGVQLDGTNDEIMPLGNIEDKFSSFGWNVLQCDGHIINEISNCIDEAKKCVGKPSMIIAHTIKGKGISFMEGKNEWHGKIISSEDYKLAMAELEGVL